MASASLLHAYVSLAGLRECLGVGRTAFEIVERGFHLASRVVEDDRPAARCANRTRRQKPPRADLLGQRRVAFSVDEERRREDVVFIEKRPIVHEKREAVAEHLDGASVRPRQALDGLQPQASALAMNPGVDVLRGTISYDFERPLPNAVVSAIGTDERLGPLGDALVERIVGSEVDGSFDGRSVEKELSHTREHRDVTAGGSNQREAHEVMLSRPPLACMGDPL